MSKPKKGPGRPRKIQIGELPIFDTQEQAVSKSGIPLYLIQLAKREGSSAFVNHRIHLKPLIEWVVNHLSQINNHDILDIRCEKAKTEQQRNIKLELENKVRAHELYEKELIHEILSHYCIQIKQIWETLPNELAHKCNPADPTIALNELNAWVKRSMASIWALRDSWKTENPQNLLKELEKYDEMENEQSESINEPIIQSVADDKKGFETNKPENSQLPQTIESEIGCGI
jgi:hypothetical protein